MPHSRHIQQEPLLESDESASLQQKKTSLKKLLGPVFIDKHDINLKENLSVAFKLKTIAVMEN